MGMRNGIPSECVGSGNFVLLVRLQVYRLEISSPGREGAAGRPASVKTFRKPTVGLWPNNAHGAVSMQGRTGTPMSTRPLKTSRHASWAIPLLLFTVGLGWALAANAQRRQSVTSGIFLPSNRLDARGIQRSRALIAKGEFSQAIRFLDEILAREEDSFVSGADDEYHGLKETARQMLRDLPREGRTIYETTFGPVAHRLLKQAVSSGDPREVRQIAQRYFYTPAGNEAALLFAQEEADQGRHLAAALTYQQLLETTEAVSRFQPQLSVLAAASWLAAGNSAMADDALKLVQGQAYSAVQIAGQPQPLRASQQERLEWLVEAVGIPTAQKSAAERQWLTLRGNAARNGQVEGGLPHLRVRWQVRLLEHHQLESVHEEMASLLSRHEQSRLPAATPLAVGDYVVTRSAHGLVAIDFKTGKRVWQAQPQRVSLLQSLMEASESEEENNNGVEPAQTFARMIWEDYLYNTISSDGDRVYVIRDLAPAKFDPSRSLPFIRQRPILTNVDDTNRLCAYDLPTQGKLVWEIDGEARSDELQGAFFLGAPVTVGQSLYCLAEIKSETAIYLLALDRKTGALRWRQQLADLERGIPQDYRRRLQASMPSYDQGVLICPTGAGVVVGVDLAKPALAWAYRYPVDAAVSLQQRLIHGREPRVEKHWVHSAPVIADGRVLLTPPESDQLHCLDLLTGKLLWKKPRGEALFLAGVEEGTALLVGNQQLSALRLETGNPAWASKSLALPVGTKPTGSGYFSNGEYFLPLSDAQVIAVDLAEGKIIDVAKSRDEQPLGNLVCYRGAVISQTGRYLDCFEQVDVLREKSEQRLAVDPADAEALRTLGEIAYNSGRLAEAIELLSQSYRSQPDDLRTREVLSEALVAALDEDFASYEDSLPLLSELQPESLEARLTLMRLQAQGLQGIGQPVKAVEVCLSAYDLLAGSDAELTIGHEHRLSARRWLSAQVGTAWAAANFEQREQIAERLRPLLEQTYNTTDVALQRHFYDCFGSLELTDPVAIALADDHFDRGQLLAAQQLLVGLVHSENSQISAAAIAGLSRLLHEAQLPYLATSYDRQLRTELAEAECLPGMTGAACLDKWAPDGETGLRQWPYGQVDVEITDLKARGNSRGRPSPYSGIQLERCDEILANCNVTMLGMSSGRNRSVTVSNGLGREFFRARLDKGSQAILNLQPSVYGVTRGNLLVLSLRRQIVAFDTTAPSRQPLWRVNTTSNLQFANQSSPVRTGKLHGQQVFRSQRNGNWLGLIGPITQNSFVFQDEQQLVCIDSLSGELRWSRENLPLGCDLFGDEHTLFVVPKDAQHALVFSMIDGRSLGETDHNLPAWQERLATVDRQIVRWRRIPNSRWELSAVDALDGEVLWKHEFPKHSQVDVAQNRFVAIAEAGGSCAIVDLRTGELAVDHAATPIKLFEKVHLMVGTDSFVVALQQPTKRDRNRPVGGFNKIDFTPRAFTGQIQVFDRKTGRPTWERSAKVQGLPLMLSQPVDLPMIAFAGNVRSTGKQGSVNETHIMLLEKATGRMLLHEEKLPQSNNHFSVQASDTEPNVAEIRMRAKKIKITFTDGPRAPEPPAIFEAQRQLGEGVRGLQKIGEKFFGGGT